MVASDLLRFNVAEPKVKVVAPSWLVAIVVLLAVSVPPLTFTAPVKVFTAEVVKVLEPILVRLLALPRFWMTPEMLILPVPPRVSVRP